MPDVSGRARVLIVDDEQVIADTLALILNKNGYSTRVAYNGEEAVRLAEFEPPDMLISDVVLGGASGVTAAVEIARIAPGCRVLLISGQAIPAVLLEDANAAGQVFEVLLKPVHPQKLLQKLKEISGQDGSDVLESFL